MYNDIRECDECRIIRNISDLEKDLNKYYEEDKKLNISHNIVIKLIKLLKYFLYKEK